MIIFTAGVVAGLIAAFVVNRFVQNSKVCMPTKSLDDRKSDQELAADLVRAWKRTRPKIKAEVCRLQSDLTAAKAENEALRGRVSELERDRDQWRAQVGRICATLPVSKIADSTMTIGNLVDYFKDLHRENERLRAEAAEKGGDDD